ncbi:MAG: hypothetical protein QXU32_02020 [Nitrososphaerales archaeon]
MNSKLSLSIALKVLEIIKQELARFGAKLVDYHIGFNKNGFIIKNVKVSIKKPNRIIGILKNIHPEVRHEIYKSPTKYAMTVASVEIGDRVNNDLGLDYKAFVYPKSDIALISVNEPEKEKSAPTRTKQNDYDTIIQPEPQDNTDIDTDDLSKDLLDIYTNLGGIEEPEEIKSDIEFGDEEVEGGKEAIAAAEEEEEEGEKREEMERIEEPKEGQETDQEDEHDRSKAGREY